MVTNVVQVKQGKQQKNMIVGGKGSGGPAQSQQAQQQRHLTHSGNTRGPGVGHGGGVGVQQANFYVQ